MKKFKIFSSYNGISREVIILFFSKIIVSLGSFVIPFLSLILTQQMDFSSSKAGLYITIVSLAYIPGIIIGGRLADYSNVKNALVLSQIISAICFLCVPLTSIIWIKLALIISSFVMLGISYPCVDTIVCRIVNRNDRKKTFSLLYLGCNIGYAIGPLLGGFLISVNSNLLFIGDGFTTIISAILVFKFIDYNRFIKNKDAKQVVQSNTTRTLTILWQRKVLLLFGVICILYNFTYAQYNFTLPLFLNHLFNFSEGAKIYGILMSINSVSVIVFTPMITKLKSNNSIVYAGVFYALGFGLYYFCNNITELAVCTFLWTWGEILFSTNFAVFVTKNSPDTHIGRISSFMLVMSRIGFNIAPLISGIIIKSMLINNIWLITFFIMVVASIFMYGVCLYSKINTNLNVLEEKK